MCLYEMTSRYKKSFKVNNPSKDKDNERIGYKVKGANKYKLKESHPGYKFSHLTQLKHPLDPIFMTTVNEKPNEEKKTKSQSPDENKIMDILQVGSPLK